MRNENGISDVKIYKRISLAIASVFGVGYIPVAPGTFGSLVGVIFAALCLTIGGIKLFLPVTAAVFCIGFYFTHEALRYSKDKDPSFIVIDEVMGQFITFLIPAIIFKEMYSSVYFYLAGFLLFRLFDITKPLYVGWADEFLEGALGVTADDVIAGIYAAALLVVSTSIKEFIFYFVGQ